LRWDSSGCSDGFILGVQVIQSWCSESPQAIEVREDLKRAVWQIEREETTLTRAIILGSQMQPDHESGDPRPLHYRRGAVWA